MGSAGCDQSLLSISCCVFVLLVAFVAFVRLFVQPFGTYMLLGRLVGSVARATTSPSLLLLRNRTVVMAASEGAHASPPAFSTRTDFSDLLTDKSRARQQSPIRALFPFLKVPGMISLGGGMPNPKTFPFAKVSVETVEGQKIDLQGEQLVSALQYSATPGLPDLLDFLTQLQEREHGPQASSHAVTVTTGSQDGLAKVFEMLLGPTDTLLLEDASYSGALSFLDPLGCNYARIRTDDHGIIPSSLEEVLASWPNGGGANEKGARRPRVLYTIPTGANPTGASLTAERKREIYAIARRPENNLLILEDDPFYFLQFTSSDDASESEGVSRADSFLSMDEDCRVVRFDSFSKILAAGVRLGFCTAPPVISERLRLHMQATCLHTCGLSQAVVGALLNKWGYDKFIEHTRKVASFYQSQRDAFLKSADRHLGKLDGKVKWTVPDAGMFVWIDLAGRSRITCAARAQDKLVAL